MDKNVKRNAVRMALNIKAKYAERKWGFLRGPTVEALTDFYGISVENAILCYKIAARCAIT